MPAPNTRVARVRTAERKGSGHLSEDRVFVAPNAVIVLDGASQPESFGDQDGGWLAETIGARLRGWLTRMPDADLVDLLYATIRDVACEFSLTPGTAPSTTVSIARWNDRTVDVLVLGDTPVVVITVDGRVIHVRDNRLSTVAAAERRAFRECRGTFGQDRPGEWDALVKAQRRVRNQPGGYWIAEASPDAANNAICARFEAAETAAVLVMTDGVANGVDRYRTPPGWAEAAYLASSNPNGLVSLVHDAEATDPNGERWPRSKQYDDKAIAVVTFG